ncbi:GIY-YIG nuclease family protein [Patescibacteria group bacterium]
MKFSKSLLNKIKNAPILPGCYIFRDKNGRILYIGKAVNIRSRVKSYFSNVEQIDPKITLMIEQIAKVEFTTTDSDLEALILETNLIKKYRPKYNRMMKDDKNYSWLAVTKGNDFPRLKFVREQRIKNVDYFGPYVNTKSIKRALKSLRKIFPYASCNRKIHYFKGKDGNKKFYSSDKKPCLYFHLNLCDAPCTGDISKASYRKNVNRIKHFFRNKKFKIVEELTKEMNKYATEKRYEEAAIIRNKLEDLSYITQRIRIEKDMDENMWKDKQESTQRKALENLIRRLKLPTTDYRLPLTDFRIECYDISNISGKSATGSMIVFTNGKPDKKSYRKFRIKTKDTPDDFEMLKEVFKRRFKNKSQVCKQKLVQSSPPAPSSGGRVGTSEPNQDKSFSTLPNLIIVDGGKGQLSSVLRILKEYNFNIPTIGLAKKEEEIIKSKGVTFKTIKLPRGSDEFFLIQRIRDEAHRFAIKYHKILRSKKQVKSVLDEIPGVGKLIRKRLLKAFGSAEGIKKANIDELQAIVKNKRTVENIKKLL